MSRLLFAEGTLTDAMSEVFSGGQWTVCIQVKYRPPPHMALPKGSRTHGMGRGDAAISVSTESRRQ